jgi:hypothetical protein
MLGAVPRQPQASRLRLPGADSEASFCLSPRHPTARPTHPPTHIAQVSFDETAVKGRHCVMVDDL